MVFFIDVAQVQQVLHTVLHVDKIKVDFKTSQDAKPIRISDMLG